MSIRPSPDRETETMGWVFSFFDFRVHLAKSLWMARAFLFLPLLLGLPVIAVGQKATIVGTVTDPSGRAIANAEITIANERTGAERNLVTNEVGQYVAPGLLIGTYDVKSRASGFKIEEMTEVVLNENDRIRIDFQMKLGQVAETVFVKSNTVAIQAD